MDKTYYDIYQPVRVQLFFEEWDGDVDGTVEMISRQYDLVGWQKAELRTQVESAYHEWKIFKAYYPDSNLLAPPTHAWCYGPVTATNPKPFDLEVKETMPIYDIEPKTFVSLRHKMMKKPVKCTLNIKKVIFNDPATIVIWADGVKTVVKCHDEEYDPEKGLAMAFCKRFLGNVGNYYNNFSKWLPKEES